MRVNADVWNIHDIVLRVSDSLVGEIVPRVEASLCKLVSVEESPEHPGSRLLRIASPKIILIDGATRTPTGSDRKPLAWMIVDPSLGKPS